MEVTESEGTLPQLPWGCRAISSLRKAQDEGLEAQGADKTLPFQTAKGWPWTPLTCRGGGQPSWLISGTLWPFSHGTPLAGARGVSPVRPASQGPDSSTETGSHVPPHPRDGEFFEGRSLSALFQTPGSELSVSGGEQARAAGLALRGLDVLCEGSS